MHIFLDQDPKLRQILHTHYNYCMPDQRQRFKPTLGTNDFDSSAVQAAYAYHLKIGASHAKGNVSVGVAAFIAGACWAKQVLLGGENK
jgi:hypothetical protein